MIMMTIVTMTKMLLMLIMMIIILCFILKYRPIMLKTYKHHLFYVYYFYINCDTATVVMVSVFSSHIITTKNEMRIKSSIRADFI